MLSFVQDGSQCTFSNINSYFGNGWLVCLDCAQSQGKGGQIRNNKCVTGEYFQVCLLFYIAFCILMQYAPICAPVMESVVQTMPATVTLVGTEEPPTALIVRNYFRFIACLM